ncbi:aldo/keto reductase [Amnibacterium sp. CER49]|uniref:aldo/keto reductase n=1 Tax=Amnibacterium sp. CER49 TaxID=3039161 RepID=UPI00244CF226|nr:aldo/keto reductase [Amnibacterium sp. CER49]MDH2445449.1 aldo/keto reductase [Amnibacterium sp. CER49]
MTDTTLETAQLGRTGMAITRVGFGAWAIGGGDWAFAWGPQDDDASVQAIHHAVDAGINWIDTAAVYGLGHSEEVVGRALRDLPEGDRPLVFTKGGLVWDESSRREQPRRVGDPASIRREAEASLKRLGVETIDLYQMHWPADDGTPIEDYWGAFVALRESGKVRAIGLSNHSVAELERAEAVGHVDALQPPFSAIHPEAADELLPWCAANGTGVIVYSPMGSGLLTGAFDADRVASLPDDDWRRNSPDFTTDLEQNLGLGRRIGEVADAHGVPQAAAAVAWTLGFEGVTGAIVGARRPDQIDGWISAAGLHLTAEDYARIGGRTPLGR